MHWWNWQQCQSSWNSVQIQTSGRPVLPKQQWHTAILWHDSFKPQLIDMREKGFSQSSPYQTRGSCFEQRWQHRHKQTTTVTATALFLVINVHILIHCYHTIILIAIFHAYLVLQWSFKVVQGHLLLATFTNSWSGKSYLCSFAKLLRQLTHVNLILHKYCICSC